MTILQGVRVVELGVWVAGPSASGVMADWGADVIKVEPPVGDPMRQMFASTGYSADIPNAPFAVDNRGKRSVVLDVATPAGRAALDRLLDTADVLLTNLRLDPLQRLKLLPADVTATRERLVYALVTGYGSTGPDKDRPGYDIGAFGARAGVLHQMVPDGEPPAPIPRGFGDHFTGLATLTGILAALWDRERTGRGQVIETSLLRTGVYAMAWDTAIQLTLGKVAGTAPREDYPTPTAMSYRAGDGKWFWLLGVEADRHFPRLVRALGRPELLEDERFSSARSRRHHRRELIAAIDEVMATASFDEWAKRFDAEDVWWSPVQTPAEVVADPQVRAAGAFTRVGGPDGFESVAAPVAFSAHDLPYTGPVPELGQHTDEVLGELGYSAEDIARLRG